MIKRSLVEDRLEKYGKDRVTKLQEIEKETWQKATFVRVRNRETDLNKKEKNTSENDKMQKRTLREIQKEKLSIRR